MTTAEDYFERSKTFAAAADVAGDPARKIRLLEMAQRWAHLAEVAERNGLLLQRHVYRNSAPGEDNRRNRAD